MVTQFEYTCTDGSYRFRITRIMTYEKITKKLNVEWVCPDYCVHTILLTFCAFCVKYFLQPFKPSEWCCTQPYPRSFVLSTHQTDKSHGISDSQDLLPVKTRSTSFSNPYGEVMLLDWHIFCLSSMFPAVCAKHTVFPCSMCEVFYDCISKNLALVFHGVTI